MNMESRREESVVAVGSTSPYLSTQIWSTITPLWPWQSWTFLTRLLKYGTSHRRPDLPTYNPGVFFYSIGTEYLKNGARIDHFPSSEQVFKDFWFVIRSWFFYHEALLQQDFEGVEVDYITLPGWQESIESCRTFEELPTNARLYVEKIEELLQVPILWIGVGQSREAIIVRKPE